VEAARSGDYEIEARGTDDKIQQRDRRLAEYVHSIHLTTGTQSETGVITTHRMN